MTAVQLRQPPAQERQYLEQLRSATPAQLALARVFQLTAFADRGRTFEPGFVPAPLYMSQAMAVTQHRVLATQLVDAIARVVEG